MEDILAGLLVADNAVIQRATKDLKEALKKDDAVPQLCSVLTQSHNPQLRQYAAVVLRQRFDKGKNWDKCSISLRMRVKNCLLSAVVNENEQFVKKSVCQLMGAIIRYEIPANTWPELLEFIFHCVASDELQQKTLGMFTLSVMTEISPSTFMNHSPHLATVIITVLSNAPNDASLLITYCIDTMKNLIPVADGDENMNRMYLTLLPRVLQTVTMFAVNDEVKACELMDMLEDLLDIAVICTMTNVKQVVNICIEIVQNQTLGDPLRAKALSVLDCTVKIKKKAIVKHNMLLHYLDLVIQVMQTPNPDDNDLTYEEESEGPDSPIAGAARVLDSLALHLPPDKLMPPLLHRIELCLARQSVYCKKASYVAMAVIVEGCAEYVTKNCLKEFMVLVCRGLREPSFIVRNAALFALGQFSEFLQPDISKQSEQLMPILFEFLDQLKCTLEEGHPEPKNVDRMFYALEAFIENSEKNMFLPFLPSLLETLLFLLTFNSSTHFKKLVLSAICACVTAAGDDIYPFFSQIVECISRYLKDEQQQPEKPEDKIALQTAAIETLSTLARAVTPEHFRPICQESVQLGLRLLENESDPDLRSSAYGLFGAISFVLKEDMASILDAVVQQMIRTLQSSEGFVIHYKDQVPAGYPAYEDSSDSEDEEDIEFSEDDDDDDVAGFSVDNSYIDEKAAACIAIKEMAMNTGSAFDIYLQPCFEPMFLKLLGYPQEDIKKMAIESLCQLCINFSKVQSDEEGNGLIHALSMFIPKLAEIIHTERERDIVAQALEAYSEMLKNIKNRVVEKECHREAIMNCIKDVFAKRTACQDQDEESTEEESSEDEEDEAEQDEMLIEYAGDAFPYLGKAITPDEFAPYFDKIMPYLMTRMKQQTSVPQRSFAVGVLAECMEPLGTNIIKFTHHVYPIFKTLCRDEHHDVRNNAVFGIGEMLYHGKEELYPYSPLVLQILHECATQEQDIGVIDNICGALSRMILNNVNIVPISEVVPCIVSCLPLKKDFKENTMVFKCLLYLYENAHFPILPHLETALLTSVSVIHYKQGDDDALLMAQRFFVTVKHSFTDLASNLRPSLATEMLPTFDLLMAMESPL